MSSQIVTNGNKTTSYTNAASKKTRAELDAIKNKKNVTLSEAMKNMEDEFWDFTRGMLRFLPKKWNEKNSSLGIMTVIATPIKN